MIVQKLNKVWEESLPPSDIDIRMEAKQYTEGLQFSGIARKSADRWPGQRRMEKKGLSY